ncbi:hypothetical protein [Streptomyces sp. TLI_146]|uniref:hypothetical protein n=1 Tax=Streptomyces sp. TLI_146 TaxID=1938858 RepID=UPI00214ADCDA|nr:hypothetical protein [Streptomyces sp. TLI_146]
MTYRIAAENAGFEDDRSAERARLLDDGVDVTSKGGDGRRDVGGFEQGRGTVLVAAGCRRGGSVPGHMEEVGQPGCEFNVLVLVGKDPSDPAVRSDCLYGPDDVLVSRQVYLDRHSADVTRPLPWFLIEQGNRIAGSNVLESVSAVDAVTSAENYEKGRVGAGVVGEHKGVLT